jgi:hypothetical protein
LQHPVQGTGGEIPNRPKFLPFFCCPADKNALPIQQSTHHQEHQHLITSKHQHIYTHQHLHITNTVTGEREMTYKVHQQSLLNHPSEFVTGQKSPPLKPFEFSEVHSRLLIDEFAPERINNTHM